MTMQQVDAAPTPEPAQKTQTVTADQIATAATAVADGADDRSAIPIQEALAAFAKALGATTPKETEAAISAVGIDGDGLMEFIRAWMSSQHDLNAKGKEVTLRTCEELTVSYRQWQDVLAQMIADAAAQKPPATVSDFSRLTAMDAFILANP